MARNGRRRNRSLQAIAQEHCSNWNAGACDGITLENKMFREFGKKCDCDTKSCLYFEECVLPAGRMLFAISSQNTETQNDLIAAERQYLMTHKLNSVRHHSEVGSELAECPDCGMPKPKYKTRCHQCAAKISRQKQRERSRRHRTEAA